MNRITAVGLGVAVAGLVMLTGCASGTGAQEGDQSASDSTTTSVATPSTANTPFELPQYTIGEKFTVADRMKCEVVRARYGEVHGQNQKLKLKLWQENIGPEPSDGCLPYEYVDVQGQKWDGMSCRSPQAVPRGTTNSTYTTYVHKCTFPAGTQIAEVYFSTYSKAGDDEPGMGQRVIVTL